MSVSCEIIETYEIYHKTRLQQLFFCLNCEQNFSKSSFIWWKKLFGSQAIFTIFFRNKKHIRLFPSKVMSIKEFFWEQLWLRETFDNLIIKCLEFSISQVLNSSGWENSRICWLIHDLIFKNLNLIWAKLNLQALFSLLILIIAQREGRHISNFLSKEPQDQRILENFSG